MIKGIKMREIGYGQVGLNGFKIRYPLWMAYLKDINANMLLF